MLRAPCRMEHPRLKKKKYRKRLNAFLRYETDGKFNLPHVNSGIVASRSTRIFLEKKKVPGDHFIAPDSRNHLQCTLWAVEGKI